MCCGCWRRKGAPRIDSAIVREIAKAVPAVNPFGPMHIVVDDGNVEDRHLDDSLRFGKAEVTWGPAEQHLYHLMKMATYDERVSALALADGCWSAP